MRGKYHLKKKMLYTYLQIRNHYEHNIKNKTDFNDQNKKSNTTEYIKEKWEREGNLSTSSETCLICVDSHGNVLILIQMEMLYSFLHITKADTKAHFSGGNSGC